MIDGARCGAERSRGAFIGAGAAGMSHAALMAVQREVLQRRLDFLVEAVQVARYELNAGSLSRSEAEKLQVDIKVVQTEIVSVAQALKLKVRLRQRG